MHGIIVIDTINFGCLEQHLSVEFSSTESCRGIGGEKRVATTSRQDNDAPLFKMAHGPAANKWLCHGRHIDCGLHACDHAQFFHSILHCQRIHDCCQHTGIVGCSAVHTSCGGIRSTPDIASADHYSNLHTQLMHPLNFTGDSSHDIRVNAIALARSQCFTAQLKQDTMILQR